MVNGPRSNYRRKPARRPYKPSRIPADLIRAAERGEALIGDREIRQGESHYRNTRTAEWKRQAERRGTERRESAVRKEAAKRAGSAPRPATVGSKTARQASKMSMSRPAFGRLNASAAKPKPKPRKPVRGVNKPRPKKK